MAGSYDVNGYIGYQAVITSITFVVVAGAFVTGRFVVRLGVIWNPGPDDWVILGSLVSFSPKLIRRLQGLGTTACTCLDTVQSHHYLV